MKKPSRVGVLMLIAGSQVSLRDDEQRFIQAPAGVRALSGGPFFELQREFEDRSNRNLI